MCHGTKSRTTLAAHTQAAIDKAVGWFADRMREQEIW